MKRNVLRCYGKLGVALGSLWLIAGWAIAETTITDSYYIAGKVGPIISVQATETARWMKAPFVASLGLEKIPGSKMRGIYGYKLVLDASAMGSAIPAVCSRRFEEPWDSLRQRFPVWSGETKHEHPPEDELWKMRREAQRYEFGSGDCTVRLWVGNVVPYGSTKLPNGTPALSDDYPGLSGKDFPGLFVRNVITVNQGRVEFLAKGQKTVINFLAHHEDIPNLRYVPAP